MSHAPSTPSVPALLVSHNETKDIKGKIRCLNKLVTYPRISNPELQQPLAQLIFHLQAVLACWNHPYSKEERKRIDVALKNMQYLEDVVIRAVITGEDIREILVRHIKNTLAAAASNAAEVKDLASKDKNS